MAAAPGACYWFEGLSDGVYFQTKINGINELLKSLSFLYLHRQKTTIYIFIAH